jgi:biopolymer transport protein ExbB/TolQ
VVGWALAIGWIKQKLLMSPQAAAVLLTAVIVALGGWSVYAVGSTISKAIRAERDAAWLRQSIADRQKHENEVLAANGRAAAAAERARQAAESEEAARQRATDLEAVLADLQRQQGGADPEAWPHTLVKELRK